MDTHYSPADGAIWSADGWLVPVEPCEHGNYDRHRRLYVPLQYDDFGEKKYYWCEGAALKGDT